MSSPDHQPSLPSEVQIVTSFAVNHEKAADPAWQSHVVRAQQALGEILGMGTAVSVELRIVGSDEPGRLPGSTLDAETENFLDTTIEDVLRTGLGQDPQDKGVVMPSILIRLDNILGKAGINTVREVLPVGAERLSRIHTLGHKAVGFFKDAVQLQSPGPALQEMPSIADIAPYCDSGDVSALTVAPYDERGRLKNVARFNKSIHEMLGMSTAELRKHVERGYGPGLNLNHLGRAILEYNEALLRERRLLGLAESRHQ